MSLLIPKSDKSWNSKRISVQYKGKGANILSKVPLGRLKPADNDKPKEYEDNAVQFAKYERIITQQVEEIAQLEAELIDEREKRDELEKKLEKITKFLEDYDLHWGGGPGPQDMTYPHGPEDMELFMRKIVELNDYASRNKPSLKLENNIARVAFEKPVLINLSNDSFSVDYGNPRQYNLPLSVQFFKDIFEGYTQWSLKKSILMAYLLR